MHLLLQLNERKSVIELLKIWLIGSHTRRNRARSLARIRLLPLMLLVAAVRRGRELWQRQ